MDLNGWYTESLKAKIEYINRINENNDKTCKRRS